MSRALNLAMTEAEVTQHCTEKGIAISVLEKLPQGGVRLVCANSYDATQLRLKLKNQIMADNMLRAKFRPRRPLW